MKAASGKPSGLAVLARRRPLLIGHRGCARQAPENTLPSFRLALKAGADLVELDFQATNDGMLVAAHDRELGRTTDAARQWNKQNLALSARSWAEVQTLDAGSWFNRRFAGTAVPSLEQALEAIHPRAIPLLERKSGEPELLLGLLRRKRLVDRVVLISFDWAFLEEVRRQDPRLLIGALGPPTVLPSGSEPRSPKNFGTRLLASVRELGARVLVWNRKITTDSIRLAHNEGLKVWVYTVNDPAEAIRLIRRGVDGIITDDPLLMRQRGPFSAL
jgi:glycerophosphoryl diester phosphodiesterase